MFQPGGSSKRRHLNPFCSRFLICFKNLGIVFPVPLLLWSTDPHPKGLLLSRCPQLHLVWCRLVSLVYIPTSPPPFLTNKPTCVPIYVTGPSYPTVALNISPKYGKTSPKVRNKPTKALAQSCLNCILENGMNVVLPQVDIGAKALHGLQLKRAPQVLGIRTAGRQPESKP